LHFGFYCLSVRLSTEASHGEAVPHPLALAFAGIAGFLLWRRGLLRHR
jgi:hypothetical protein